MSNNMSSAQSISSHVEINQQQRDLLEKIKNASNGPEHAKRRIEALDKMVQALKLKRKKCGEAIEKDTASLDWINKELERLNKQYLPLCNRLEERETTMDTVQKNLELAEKTMLNIMNETRSTSFSGMISYQRMSKKAASEHLKSERGFGVEPETTYYQGSRRSRASHK